MTISLTSAEQKVVDLIAGQLLNYRQTAKVLGWSKHTVRNYVRRIAQKLPGDASSQRKVISYYGNRAA